MLANLNKHPRDDFISFTEEGHIYTLIKGDSIVHPISVTTLIHKYFPHFDADSVIDKILKNPKPKYMGKTKAQIMKEWDDSRDSASRLGTLMHADIERYLNNDPPLDPNTTEFGYFLNFWSDFKSKYPTFKPYRTEWIVYDEDKNLSGSIDCVLANDEGDIILIDWKRSKEIKSFNSFEKGYIPFDKLDNCNYNHYTLQLNIYRHLLESKYNRKIIFMMLVILHPNNIGYQTIPVNIYDVASLWDSLFK